MHSRTALQIKEGESLLVLGAAGGVSVLPQLNWARRQVPRSSPAVSSEEKAQFCRDLGADETIIYSRDMSDRAVQKEFSTQIKKALGR